MSFGPNAIRPCSNVFNRWKIKHEVVFFMYQCFIANLQIEGRKKMWLVVFVLVKLHFELIQLTICAIMKMNSVN